MSLKSFIDKIFGKGLFNTKWKCLVCEKEIFEGYFCDECKSKLLKIGNAYCDHCGRKLNVSAAFCTTCKGRLTKVDKARSLFEYRGAVSILIKKAKYSGAKYIYDAFTEDLKNLYLKTCFNADFITFVPSTEKAEKERGYNQSRILAENLSGAVNVPIFTGVKKVKDTPHQAGLNRKERAENLKTAFRIVNKKSLVGKSVLIVDDVTTTGATSEALAGKLKRAGASKVYLMTLCSVTPEEKF